MGASADAIFSEDLAGRITSWNAGAERLYGRSAEGMLGRCTDTLVPEKSSRELYAVHARALSGDRVERFDSWHLRPDGKHVPISLTVSPLRDSDGAIAGLATGVEDLTERIQHTAELAEVHHTLEKQHLALARSNRDLEQFAYVASAQEYMQLARGLLDALEAATCAVSRDGVIVAVNAAWNQFTAGPDGASSNWAVGTNYLQNCDDLAAAGLDFATTGDISATGIRSVLAGSLERHQHDYSRPIGGEVRWFSVRVSPADIGGGGGAVVSHVDVTDLHRAHIAVKHQALHDSLTGLPNRLLLADRLEQACADARRHDRHVGLAFLDLDHFKRINDSLGHATADGLLVQVAARLTEAMREGDTLSRYSGDEFVVVWPDMQESENVSLLGARLSQALENPFDLGETAVNLSASVGLAVGEPATTADDLLMRADAAMYDAKRHGGGRLRVFSDELRQGVVDLMTTEVELRVALTHSELVLHYQPVIDLDSGQPVAVEALARWQHPRRGLLAPGQFIPVAESSGLIVPLGKWAIEQACQDAADFTGASQGLDVAVNLSVRQLSQPDIVEHVRDVLQRSGLDPQRLMLEVTESVCMEDTDAAALALNGLALLGVRIAIDDFGTGYCSLLYLRRYPISVLKVDRAFVSGIGLSLNDEAICSSVVNLAQAVGATSVGEGVETMEQLVALHAIGCQQAQGFLWSPAVPAGELNEALARCTNLGHPQSARTPSRRRSAPAPKVAQHVAERVQALRADGASAHTIAAALNRARVPRPDGLQWTATGVSRHIPVLVGPGRQ
ncbi:MAG: sensor domain-containing protein [Mycobacteriales bacterium]